MPNSCSAYGCTNRSSSTDSFDRNVAFHSFPHRNPKLLKEWLVNIGRRNFTPSTASRICSDHFEAECFTFQNFTNMKCLKKGSVPTKFVFNKMYCRKLTKYHFEMKADPGERSSTDNLKSTVTSLNSVDEKNLKLTQHSSTDEPENQNQSANTITFLVPLNMLKQISLSASDSLHWNKHEMTALIALYQSEKCLYDKKHENYHDLHESYKAYERIKNVLANMNFICTIPQIENKIASLCSKYASEKAYKDRCIQAGQITEDTYAPTMWCFGLLQFLDDYMETITEIEIKTERIEKEDQHDVQLLNSNVDHPNIKVEPEEVLNMEENVPLKMDTSFSLNTSFNEDLKVNRRGMETKEIFFATNKLNYINIFSQDSEEKEDIFGEYIASEMKTLKDNPLLYMRTKQAIIDVLTSANFDLLIPD